MRSEPVAADQSIHLREISAAITIEQWFESSFQKPVITFTALTANLLFIRLFFKILELSRRRFNMLDRISNPYHKEFQDRRLG